MFATTGGKGKWSDIALKGLIASTAITALLAIPHAIFEGWFYGLSDNRGVSMMLVTFVADTRYLFEQIMFVAAVILVGAKFFESRTTFAVTFDRVDAGNISVRGPDGDNVVWIGQRYGTELEAQAVVATIENRLKENAAA